MKANGNGASSKNSKTRRKLKSFDWTDEAIEETSRSPLVVTNSKPDINDMESKIARVQQRKKEAHLREQKKKTALANSVPNLGFTPPTPSATGTTDINEIVSALNSFFELFINGEPHLVGASVSMFPMELYDDSTNDETCISPAIDDACACLVSEAGPEGSPRNRGLGRWYPAIISSVSEGRFCVTVEGGDVKTVGRMSLCLEKDRIQSYVDRIISALRRRSSAVTLLRYYFYVNSMPFDITVASSLSDSQATRIAVKSCAFIPSGVSDAMSTSSASFAFSMGHTSQRSAMNPVANLNSRLLRLLSNLLVETKEGFEFVMKKLTFDANMLCVTNHSLLRSLQIEPRLLLAPPIKAQDIVVPSHDMKTIIRMLDPNSFLSCGAALGALQGAVLENCRIAEHVIQKFTYETSYTLSKFERAMSEQLMKSLRSIKQDWPAQAAASIRECLDRGNQLLGSTSHPHYYDVSMRTSHDYEVSRNPIKRLLERINFMMSDTLFNMMKKSIMHFVSFFEDLCGCEIAVKSCDSIIVDHSAPSIYKRQNLPPLFACAIVVSPEPGMLNAEAVEANIKEIDKWKASPEAEVENAHCPIPPLEPIMGKMLVYNNAPDEFKELVLSVFDSMLSELQDVPHIQKHAMDKIFWPNPRTVEGVTDDLPWVMECRERLSASLDASLSHLVKYLKFFKSYETIINVDTAVYIESRIPIQKKDPESTEIELPVTVDVKVMATVLQEHLDAMTKIENSLPIHPLDCGLFTIDVAAIRTQLLEKHDDIVKSILRQHASNCMDICQYLDDEFRKVIKNLSKRPDDIEQLTELEEYISGVANHLAPLDNGIGEMMKYHDILDKFQHRVDPEHLNFRWNVFRLPTKVHSKCEEVTANNISIKRRFNEEMQEDQKAFLKTLADIEKDVVSLENYVDVTDVDFVSERVKSVEAKLQAAQDKARLFNSREALFEENITDYEDLTRLNKMCEPYSFLWNTTKEWTDSYASWTKGKFIDLDAETIEANVERHFGAINRAYKFFSKQDMERQTEIAATIKQQVTDFRPEVPAIVSLRNPGMRDRHWEAIAAALEVDIMPIERFTTEEVLAMNLKDHIEVIQKIAESAAKEFQIEQALNKMEREWESKLLLIHPYRETGTGVLKGIDDINTILDEQITMTQAIMFSAFKGPFEERIDEWNRKLCAVSDVLEVWVLVQRNWLYLQPIFESADINRQLPTEGKKFATVDKNWRGTISAAKANPKVLEFCDNEKLLERFKECEMLLDQVQKGLSDYLETKRSVFARFYFLSNDELLSILSESKDVMRVQPHLKKCFEGIDKVKFLEDLSIDRIISPEGEEVMMTEAVNPVGKGVEHWMLELEGMMRISIRDVMNEAIKDYLVTPRPDWMQKWPGMCVLNGSQLHWTLEMEDLFAKEKGAGPKIMLDKQVAQLADMTKLVRGDLGKHARITVGALTVIDVHARDVIKKLVDYNVDSKDNFMWTSQLRYYWDQTELTVEMVAARRPYGYEYLGNTFRLVITPLTDKCYLTLMGALQMIFGGAHFYTLVFHLMCHRSSGRTGWHR